MIDIENQVYTEIATALREAYEGIYVTSVYVPSPAQFPCVSIIEEDNYMDSSTSDSGSLENHVIVMYEVNVYSNKQATKKSECREIIALVDSLLAERNFTRTTLQPVPNELDATVYRLTARYEAEVDKNEVIYRR